MAALAAIVFKEGLVTLPTPQRLMPILLALPCALLVARGRAGRGLVSMAALVALAIGALVLAARGGLAAGYHSYKLLFVLTPLAAAMVGAALTRLVVATARASELEDGPHPVAAATPLSRRDGRGAGGEGLQRLNDFAHRYGLAILASTDGRPLSLSLRSHSNGSGTATAQLITLQLSQNWTRTNADEHGHMSVVGHQSPALSRVEGSVVASRLHYLALGVAAVLLMLAGTMIEERPLASFERAADGQIAQLAPSSGELIYLRHDPANGSMRAVDLDFGGALRITGWDTPARAAAGDPITIGLRWQAPRALEQALFPELQILNAAGQPIATSLAAPQGGFYPTWRWRPGETVAEQRRIQLPPDLAPGVYQVAVRVHDFVAGHALEVPGGADGPARIGEIVIE